MSQAHRVLGLNGAVLRSGVVVQIHAVVHIGTQCPPETVVPIGFVAVGDPAALYSAAAFAEKAQDLGFTQAVFGFDTTGWPNKRATEALCDKYARHLITLLDSS